MQPIHFPAPEALAPYVAFYGIFDVGEGFSEPYVSPPLGYCGIIICLDQTINAKLNGKLFMEGPWCVTGQVTSPMVGDVTGRNRILMVFIQPCGLYQLFGINMSTLTNTSLPLSQIIGEEECQLLIRHLNDAADHAQMVKLVSGLLLAHLPVFEMAPKVAQALEFIHMHKGKVTVKEMEAACFITSRSLERHFKMYVGLSPKDYAKIFRFKCLVNYIHQHPCASWDSLCEDTGFYDQSHLKRHMVKYLNIKPEAMISQNTEYLSYLLQEI